MGIVTERIDSIPVEDIVHNIQRDESLLHQWPDPKPMNIWQSYDPIGSINLPLYHIKRDFSPPQGVFEREYIHVEYKNVRLQLMWTVPLTY